MSESVSILIKADDQASKPIVNAANTFESSQKRINAVAVQAGTSYREMGRGAKSATEFVGSLANISGSPALASLAGQIAQITERTGQFSEVSKAGGAGALAFKLGLAGLVGVLAFKVGQAIGDVVFQTKKLNDEFERGRVKAKEFQQQLAEFFAKDFAAQSEEFELIRDPEKKQAAYEQLFHSVGNNLKQTARNLTDAENRVKELNENDSLFGVDLKDKFGNKLKFDIPLPFDAKTKQAAADEVEALKAKKRLFEQQYEQLEKIKKTQQNASANYVANLKEENEYLQANREEQIKLDAARNASAQDRGEAERLLRERDAILAKVEAEKKLNAERGRPTKDAVEFEADLKAVTDLVKTEEQRLKLQRIEIEKGKEAAKVEELKMRGVSEETAKRLAAEEATLDRMRSKKESGGEFQTSITATQGRLLTRGLVRTRSADELLEEILRFTKMQTEGQTRESDRKAAADAAAASAYRETKEVIERKGTIMFASPPS